MDLDRADHENLADRTLALSTALWFVFPPKRYDGLVDLDNAAKRTANGISRYENRTYISWQKSCVNLEPNGLLARCF